MATAFQITIDREDAALMSRFWSTALGHLEPPSPPDSISWPDPLRADGSQEPPSGAIGAIADPDGIGRRVLSIPVPEPETVRNQWLLDLRAGRSDDQQQSKFDELNRAGATTIRRNDEHGGRWTVMADPEADDFRVT